MAENSITTKHRFFAAANGYGGFVSYFDSIFNSADFEQIYVLKGGPGTGKSSFMKRLEGMLSGSGCKTEAIFCSSDPYSLDGVIGEANGKKVAVLDGTAPHERDAKIPGAIDEIINLGEGWDPRWLEAEREKILTLNKEKSDAYRTAYYYLSLAGHADKEIRRAYLSRFDYPVARRAAARLAKSFSKGEGGAPQTRLVSSFGKYGKYKLDTARQISEVHYSLNGREEICEHFLALLAQALKDKGVSSIICPTALNHNQYDTLISTDKAVSVSIGEEGEAINSDRFLKKASKLMPEQIKLAEEVRTNCLTEAQRWFAIASDMHFRLEDIYTRSMNFERCDKIFEEKSQKIFDILSL